MPGIKEPHAQGRSSSPGSLVATQQAGSPAAVPSSSARRSITSAPEEPTENEDTESPALATSAHQPTPEQIRARNIQIRNRRLCYIETNHSEYFSNSDLELADPLLYDKCIRKFQTSAEREAEGKAKGWSGILHADLERAEARMEALRKASEDPSSAFDYEEDTIQTKEEGRERWEEAMTRRFLAGEDEDVDYSTIDDNEAYDDTKQLERDVEDAYFDAESPSVEGPSTDTGIQDF